MLSRPGSASSLQLYSVTPSSRSSIHFSIAIIELEYDFYFSHSMLLGPTPAPGPADRRRPP